MDTQDGRDQVEQLERTSVLLRPDTMAALRALAEAGDRPLAREIRRAVETHVEREQAKGAA
jgi:predicted transcriptional regulator